MNADTERNTSHRQRNRSLLLIIAIALLTTVVPYVMYYTGLGIPEGTTNEGILVAEPVSVTGFRFSGDDGQRWNLAEQQPRFRLVIPVFGDCDETCRNTLYITRQVHARLSGKRDQLERLYVQLGEDDSAGFKAFLAEEHPELKYLRGDYNQWRDALRSRPELAGGLTGGEYYLLHRYGALGMAYNERHTGNQLLDDLEFLIKTSN